LNSNTVSKISNRNFHPLYARFARGAIMRNICTIAILVRIIRCILTVRMGWRGGRRMLCGFVGLVRRARGNPIAGI
jgi:hypothetical protein